MRIFFRRKPQPVAHEEVETPESPERYHVMQCAGCARRLPPFVYMSNGKDYCLPCARQVARVMRLVPAGKRTGDITELDH